MLYALKYIIIKIDTQNKHKKINVQRQIKYRLLDKSII